MLNKSLKAGMAVVIGLAFLMANAANADESTPHGGSAASDDASVGTLAWSSPSSALALDGSFASASVTFDPSTYYSHYLKVMGFGFSIPAGATINGINVTMYKQCYNCGTQEDYIVKLVKGGSVVGDNNAIAGPSGWPYPVGPVSYGGPSDLWGETWTSSDINSADFGFVFSVIIHGISVDVTEAEIDYAEITVYYTPDPCAYQGSGDWNIDISDGCVISTDTDIGSNSIIVTGSSGTLTVDAAVSAKDIRLEPTDFNGDFVVHVNSGGTLSAEP
jgi:hypothetical protein